jgi:hypothetical protein
VQANENDDDNGGDGKVLCSLEPDRQPFHGVIWSLPLRPPRG